MIRRCAALVAALLLAACGRQQAQQSASPAPIHDELRLAFRTSFLNSCLKGVAGPAGEIYCNCTDERLEATMTDSELSHLTARDPRFRDIAHACAKKAGLAVRPGH